MFTGIVETIGTIQQVITMGTNKTFWIESSLAKELKADQSLSHGGVCLTVEEVTDQLHRVTAIEETLKKTNLDSWQKGDMVNLERCLQLNARIDGHFVQGHIDAKGICKKQKERKGSWEFTFEFPKQFAELIIEKGSICINGISLTAFNVTKKKFTVAIIPYTYQHTNLKSIKKDDTVNLEFDIIGKYLHRRLSLKEK
ncbi:MAG: riboflavin synthase [Bacteroidota bacterium]|nr:riboflavin synthase [Bacteroidota bacterium]